MKRSIKKARGLDVKETAAKEAAIAKNYKGETKKTALPVDRSLHKMPAKRLSRKK